MLYPIELRARSKHYRASSWGALAPDIPGCPSLRLRRFSGWIPQASSHFIAIRFAVAMQSRVIATNLCFVGVLELYDFYPPRGF
jgi:hypothetical protein